MPAGYPVKVNYLTGDVLTAANLNDLAGTVNFYDPTAKGDLFPATAADAVSRLAVGANDTILTADSTAATGMKWAAVAGGGMTVLASGAIGTGAISFTISTISGSYIDLKLVIKNYLPSTQRNLQLQFNGDAGTNYVSNDYVTTGAGLTFNAQSIRLCEDQITTGTNFIEVDIFDYANATTRKLTNSLAITQQAATPTYGLTAVRGAWNNTGAITSLTLILASGTFTAGTYVLYGIK